MAALKAQWVVAAGLVPGEPMERYGRTWQYTSTDYQLDGNRRGAVFERCQQVVRDYVEYLQSAGLNWVTQGYVWM